MSTDDRLPYGSWPSPISPEDMPTGSLRLGHAQYVGDEVWWTESVPAERGRTAIMRGSTESPVLPAPWSARSRVHEYGGGAWTMLDGPAFAFVEQRDQRVYRAQPGEEPRPLTPAEGRYTHGDLVWADGGLWAVRETHAEAHGTPVREIVRIPVDGSAADDANAITVVIAGSDFLAYPAPHAGRIAWIAWDHPDMPWDAAELRVGTLDETGSVGEWVRVAGGRSASRGQNVSALQPEWLSEDELLFTQDPPSAAARADRSWTSRWNLFRIRFDDGLAHAAAEPIHAVDGDTGGPLWSLGSRWYAPLDDGNIIAVITDGRSRLMLIDPVSGAVAELETPLTGDVQIHDVRGRRALLTGAGAAVPGGLWELDVSARSLRALRGGEVDLSAGVHSIAEPKSYEGALGPVHSFYYPPKNGDLRGLENELPPVLVLVHGGPTGHVTGDLSQNAAFFTSRGIGVLDVNYGGSSGYGRPYRDRLAGGWGIVDVQDVATAVGGLVAEGLADPERIAIKGGSAGGWTVLCALADTDVFSAGISRYGVADLRLLLAETHDFEARYLDSLVGPYPEAEQEYIDRSPLTHPEKLRTPLLILQGADDPVVPPSQSESLRDAVAANGVPHAYLLFDGESHGFRQADTIVRSFESELSFLGQVLGFATPGIARLELSR
jgi:dipeptidyl aminopeptidase/acylaminoacyl peptidase